MTRALFLRVHRWVGLVLAAFLAFSGVTGTIIAFHDELDRALNPHALTADVVDGAGDLPPSAWVSATEAAYPHAYVGLVRAPSEPGDVAIAYLSPRLDVRTGKAQELAVEQVFIHPQTGVVLGARQRGAVRLDRMHLMPLLYELHYSLALGKTGMWIFGVVGVAWLIDCFVALRLAWPRASRRAIAESLSVKRRSGRARFIYDVHRAGGLWTFVVLVVLAFSGVSMNLHEAVFKPALKLVFPTTPEAYELLPATRSREATMPVALERAIAIADTALRAREVDGRFANAWIENTQGFYGVRFHSDRDLDSEGANTTVYVSGMSGELLGVHVPGEGTLGDAVVDWQFPLHSGKAFGVAGRVVVAFTGLVVPVLVVTGVMIWWKKRRAARAVVERRAA